MLLFILISLIGWSVVQPQHTAPSLTCYTCDGHHHQIPACLASHTSCSKNEICQVNYAGGATKMKCRNSNECTHQTAHSNRQCSTGGAVVHETCQVCCSNQTCVEHFKTMALNTAQHIELGVHCPADCTSENLSMCITSGLRCATSQFCKVTLDEVSGHAHGQCIDNGDITQCRAEAAAAACDAGHDRCTAGCCTDDACVASSLGAKTTSYWSFLNGECVDQLAGDQCHDVDSTQHLCNDRLAVRVCPSTCGLCSLYNTTICQDMLAHAGCHSLVLTDNICSDSNVARDICPRTCGMCDEVIDQKLQAALQETQVTATGAPTPQAVTPATLLLPSCAALAMLDCHLLVNICPLVSCHHVCDSCFYSATTPQGVSTTETSTSPTTPQPSTTSPTTPQPSTSPTTPQPSTSPTTPQPSTSPTTPQPAITPTGPQVCEDTLDTVLPGLLCSAVENVCFDAQVVNCRKYCGLCTAAAVNQTTAGSASGSVHTTTITTPPSASPTHVSTQSATKRTTVAPVSTQGASVPTTAPMTTQTATKLTTTASVTTKPTTAAMTTKSTTTAPVTTKPTTTAPMTTNPTTVPLTTNPTTTVPVTTQTVSKPTTATPRPTTPSSLPTTAAPVTTTATPMRTTPASVSTHVTQTPAPVPTTGTPTPAPFTTTVAPQPCQDSLVCTDDSCRNPVLVSFCPKYCGVC